MRDIKVVQVCLAYHPESGGSAVSVAHFAGALGSTVVNFSDRRPTVAQPNVFTVPLGHSFLGRKFAWASSATLEPARICLEQADLIVCHIMFRYHIQWAAEIASKRHIPFWVVPHGSLDPYVFTYRKLQKEIWMRLVGNSILSKAAAVIFATTREKEKAELRGIRMNSRTIGWPYGSVEMTTPNLRRPEIRQLLGIAPQDRALLYIGRLHQMKRPIETIRALAESGAGNVHLIMVGGDENVTADECRQAALSLGLTSVHVIGPVFDNRKWDYFAAADAFISLSHRENFGYTVAEALLAEKPVILSPGNDLAADLAEAGCGWMLKNGTAEDAANAIREFSRQSDDELRARGARGLAWALANLSEDQFHLRLKDLVTETLARPTAS